MSAEQRFDTSDGQTSVQLFYWYNPTDPMMMTGKGADYNVDSDLDYTGKSKPTPGVELSFPVGKNNSLRMSYFRTQGGGSTVAGAPDYNKGFVVWGANFSQGDLIATSYTLQNVKISLDYLSWPFPVNNARFRFKTLWEVQYTTIRSSADAVYAPQTDSSGNAIQTSGTGSDWFIWPSFGVGMEYMISRHFRFEAKGSGFGIPHHAAIWDADAFFAYRFGSWELDFGGKAFHFKTSPQQPQYMFSTMPGAFAGIRWYP